ncbi:alkaline phosphatase family protein [Engelhardtia mirabilis]|uniref:Type I phosphodiesterase / nucleotide pyrophosphatase n=1 Tax=Engelhardtia mirabilis TaxID=2528011 RepID=A0A518BFS4_9BACT|nr:Type I phosphodiesterase / nucleotide pyrophosphatase [Planctomycetes bacterium Pla133]QDV00163.1 Type I phosphodiesterase / nucleotide pyrophosphatase [Planctomycetes bacterium Pla86]
MQIGQRTLRAALATIGVGVLTASPASAYVGPGAGFAAAGGALVLVGTFALAFGIVAIWPLKAAVRWVRMRGVAKPKVKRMIVVGLDGFDPGLAKKFSEQGLMPNFKALEEQGCFAPLATAYPSISPVAWSSYATGVDASRHNIYDFLTRDPCNYLPMLSSTEIKTLPRTLNLGLAKVPFGHKVVNRLLQKSQPFWKLLGDNYVWSSIIRVPITFPAQKFKNGTLLAGMCVPDLQGTQGSFSFYSTKPRPAGQHIGGQQFTVRRSGNRIDSNLTGPHGADGSRMKCPFGVELDEATRKAKITVGDETHEVGFREYTPWMTVPFKGVTGIARFYIQDWDKDGVGIYVTPININPDDPAMPISHPFVYAIYLAKMQGPYATLGLAEDTWALNERVVDEEAFLKQAWLIFEERKKQLWDVLDKTKRGFVTVVFDTTDRISHMFYRYLDPEHPANAGKDIEKHKDVIPQLYAKMDEFLVEIRDKVKEDPETVLMIISDHGFCNFTRCVNLNSWLRDEGYLVMKDGKQTSGDYFADVDWDKTRAFTLGLTGIFINRKGREAKGTVSKGPEMDELLREIKGKLEALRDPKTGDTVVKEAFITKELHSGPYADMAPELLVGYARNYRHSWDCATGGVSEEVFSDNTKSWSGDHCVDPRLVPGVFWCNRAINTETPNIMDIAPTALDQFGVKIPAYMQGQPLFGPRKPDATPKTAPAPASRPAADPAREVVQ